jgi:hypothetical protein
VKAADTDAISRLRVFVSSTFEDLRLYRESVLESIHSLGNFTDDMVYWPADDRDARAYSVDRVRQSDLLVLVIAHRHGTGTIGTDCSIVEAEYETAVTNDIPILAFIIDDAYPWPPALCDWKNLEKLASFKDRLRTKHTVRYFTTPDNLARLVTESIASFVSKKTGARLFTFPSGKYLIEVSQRDRLATIPDVIVGLQRAEDGLPLLAYLQRSEDLNSFFLELEARKPNLSSVFPDEIVDELRSSLTSRKRLQKVEMLDGTTELLYVSKANLAALFRSLFSLIVEQCRSTAESSSTDAFKQFLRRLEDVTKSTVPAVVGTPETGQLQSTGGINRFLGISLSDDKLYSIGFKNGKWIEWHPFVLESLEANFPKTRFRVAGNEDVEGEINTLSDRLIQYAVDHLPNDEQLSSDLTFTIPRQSVGLVCLQVANAIAGYHSQKRRVHGDLKPSNVLLTDCGPRLVDAFEVTEGDPAPGWSPYWSAPELVTGQPVVFESDVYSFGRLLGDLVGGHVVGEVRKFKIPPEETGIDEVDLYFDPTLFLQRTSKVVPHAGRSKWRALIERCLRFRPEQRINISDATSQLKDLLVKYPLEGEVSIRIPGAICAARLPNGAHVIARMIVDGTRPPKIPEIAINEGSRMAFFDR